MVLWLYSMAVGHGLACKIFSSSLFVDTLAPISYFNYLFHQLIGQYYWLITRNGQWWSYWRYRKAFYWFSPAPVPTAWWEYFFVVALTTWWSMGMARIDPWLIAKWNRGRSALQALCGAKADQSGGPLSTLEVLLNTVENMTGTEVQASSTFAEVGLASVAAPVLIGLLSDVLPDVTISLADLVAVQTMGELAELLEARSQEGTKSGV